MSQPKSICELDAQLTEGVETLVRFKGRLGELLTWVESKISDKKYLPTIISQLTQEVENLCNETQKCVRLRVDLDRFNTELKGREEVLNKQLADLTGIQSSINQIRGHDIKSGIETLDRKLEIHKQTLRYIENRHNKIDENMGDYKRTLDAHGQQVEQGIQGFGKKLNDSIAGFQRNLDQHQFQEARSIQLLTQKLDGSLSLNRGLDGHLRLVEVQKKIDGSVSGFGKKLDESIGGFEKKLDQGISGFEKKLGGHELQLKGMQDLGAKLDNQKLQLDTHTSKLQKLDKLNDGFDNLSDMTKALESDLPELKRLAGVELNQTNILEKISSIEEHLRSSPDKGDEGDEGNDESFILPISSQELITPVSAHYRSTSASKRKRTYDSLPGSDIPDDSLVESEIHDEDMLDDINEWKSLLSTLRVIFDVSVEDEAIPTKTLTRMRRLLLSYLGYQETSPERFQEFLNDDGHLDQWVCVATLCEYDKIFHPNDDYCGDCSKIKALNCLQIKKNGPRKSILRMIRWKN
ncbi:hypothetical protein NUW58_g817 [Xylaria curta]|uniref:Uncharacterized protein n=1 Tax=Xylaria curta TaxID=42375 RepID=A0ACC1PR56_9PEZI|nr:hypothetical protein NUW58_g817 [Xylaria curta]